MIQEFAENANDGVFLSDIPVEYGDQFITIMVASSIHDVNEKALTLAVAKRVD